MKVLVVGPIKTRVKSGNIASMVFWYSANNLGPAEEVSEENAKK